MRQTTFEAVLFDMDGTLVDTEPYWLEAESALMARHGHIWSEDDQRHCLGGPLPRVGDYMHSLVGVNDATFFMNELIAGVEKLFQRGITFMPGGKELLTEIHKTGIPLALVSASPRTLVNATLNSLAANTFQVSVSSNDVSKSKPDPEPYIKAASMLGVNIANCLVLEDSIVGITSAQASGALTLAIPHIVEVAEHPRTIVVESLLNLDVEMLHHMYKDLLPERMSS
jgi:HAD superfamily hydrolase (TIGR01509 family)